MQKSKIIVKNRLTKNNRKKTQKNKINSTKTTIFILEEFQKNQDCIFLTHWQTKEKTRAQANYLLLQLFLRLDALDFLDCVSNRINSIWMPNGHHDSCSSGVARRSTPSAPWIITRVVAI